MPGHAQLVVVDVPESKLLAAADAGSVVMNVGH